MSTLGRRAEEHPRRVWRRTLALVLPVTLAAVPVSAASAVPPVASAPAARVAPETAASVRAQRTGQPVEVTETLSETTRVVANPDGSFTADLHIGPTRFRTGDGQWRDVDLTLETRPDGTVAPRAHPRGLRMAGAAGEGVHDVARLETGESRLALGWRGRLPAPRLEETRAIYPDVRPGIDLVVEVTRTGFEQLLVVKDRKAAAGLETIDMPWRTEGLTPTAAADGGLELHDPSGARVGFVPAPKMWDATVSPITGEHTRRSGLTMRVRKTSANSSTTDLSLSPPMSFLNDPTANYPVVIDPAPTLKPGFDTYVQTGHTDDKSTDQELKLGFVVEDGSWTARSFLRWSTSFLSGKQVTAARMYLWNHWSYSCNPATWQVWITGSVGTGTRWTNQPAWGGTGKPVVSSDMTKGYNSNCGDGYVVADVRPTFQWAATNRATQLTTGLRATQAAEDNHNQSTWKRFHSSENTKDPYVSITYNSTPNPPTNLTIGGKTCATGAGRPFVSRTPYFPTMQARLTDPDGTERSLAGQFYLARLGQALPATPTVTHSGVTAGHYASRQIPASFPLTENVTYYFQMRASDGLASSAWSVICEFTVDSVGPAQPPTVTSTDYPECVPASCDTAGGVGVAGRFTFGANGATDVVGYRYWWDGEPKIQVAAPAAGGSVNVPITPPALGNVLHLDDVTIGGQRVLHVESYDAAGRSSAEYRNLAQPDDAGGYSVLVGSAPGPAGWWRMDDDPNEGPLVDASGNGNHAGLRRFGFLSDSGLGDGGTSIWFSGPGYPGGAVTSNAVLQTAGSVSVAAWIRPAAVTEASTAILSQAADRADSVEFELYVTPTQYCVARRTAAGATAASDTVDRLCAGTIRYGQWTHLAATHDRGRQRLVLYVNGTAIAEKPLPNATSTLGPFQMADGSGPNVFDYFSGAIDQVRAWNRTLDPREVAALSAVEVGRWDLDGSGIDTTAHPRPHDLLSAAAGVSWDDNGHLESDLGAAQFDGATALSTDPAVGRVVATDQSFSVSTWVQLSQVSARQSAAGQDGTRNSGFFLGTWESSTGPRWAFAMTDTDVGTGARVVVATAPAALVEDDIGRWVHLVGVFDATAQQIRLYVDGLLVQQVARTARWSATGPLTFGRTQWTTGTATGPAHYLTGGVDAVRVYTGVLTPPLVTRLFETVDGQL